MSNNKNPTAVQIGQRIKQARRMAGFSAASQLLDKIPGWGPSRLGNYEAGISLPSSDDVKLIAKMTDSSPCWIMFGLGPIRSTGRDTQAIRHQNFTFIFDTVQTQRGMMTKYLKAIGLSRNKIQTHLNNPFLSIPDRIARKCEKFTKKSNGWMDEQHVKSDPVCAAFPEDMRTVMEIFSNLSEEKRKIFLEITQAFNK